MTARQRIALVTGASSGIGKQVAKALVARGWRVIATGRDPQRMAAAEAEIGAACDGGGAIEMLPADLSLLAGAERLAEAIAARTDRLDVLFNNAGGMTDRLEMTCEGLEANYAGNHLGPFLLTERLLPLLRAAAAEALEGAVRILMTSSEAGEWFPAIDLDDLQNLKDFNPGSSYCAGKLANVLFARGLAERLRGSGITVHAMAPGPVASNFYSYAPQATKDHIKTLELLSEEEGADTLIWLATAEEAGRCSGLYWERRKVKQPNPLAEDAALVERFWQASAKLIAAAKVI